LYDGGEGGDLKIKSGRATYGYKTGNVEITTPYGTYGDILLHTGDSNDFETGKIELKVGFTHLGESEGGRIELTPAGGSAGGVNIIGGESFGNGGDISLKGGSSLGGVSGNIILEPGQGSSSGIVEVLGSGTYTGTWMQASDQRFKKNIKNLENSLNKVLSLNGISYEWKRDEFPEKNFEMGEQIGLIAQDVEKIIPELVSANAEGYKSISYQNLSAVLIEAMKEQQEIIENQKDEIRSLRDEFQVLKSQLENSHLLTKNEN
jgi:hypothetical protein